MKTKFLVLFLLTGAMAFAGPRVFVGIGVGGYGYPGYYAPPPPPPVYYAPPPIPAPGYTWVAGYYYPVGPRWVWRPGYWAAPRYGRVGPRYYGRPYYWRR
jgi:hypothetical protein